MTFSVFLPYRMLYSVHAKIRQTESLKMAQALEFAAAIFRVFAGTGIRNFCVEMHTDPYVHGTAKADKNKACRKITNSDNLRWSPRNVSYVNLS